MWRRVSCEQPLHKSQSVLSPRRNPMSMGAVTAKSLPRRKSLGSTCRREDHAVGALGRAKGNPVPIPEPGSGTVPSRAL